MSITITITADNGEEARWKLASLLGTRPGSTPLAGGPAEARRRMTENATDAPPVDNDHVAEGATPFSDADVAANAPTRKRGEPAPGKARRTKAEIAEDDAADAAEAQPNISSDAEDRVDPDNQDDAATAAADAADEAAEADAGRDTDKPLTIDDVKALAVEYQEKYGFEAVQEDGAKIFVEAVGTPPEGEKFWKFSILPTDQDSLKKLATIWRKAIDLNPLKREVKNG